MSFILQSTISISDNQLTVILTTIATVITLKILGLIFDAIRSTIARFIPSLTPSTAPNSKLSSQQHHQHTHKHLHSTDPSHFDTLLVDPAHSGPHNPEADFDSAFSSTESIDIVSVLPQGHHPHILAPAKATPFLITEDGQWLRTSEVESLYGQDYDLNDFYTMNVGTNQPDGEDGAASSFSTIPAFFQSSADLFRYLELPWAVPHFCGHLGLKTLAHLQQLSRAQLLSHFMTATVLYNQALSTLNQDRHAFTMLKELRQSVDAATKPAPQRPKQSHPSSSTPASAPKKLQVPKKITFLRLHRLFHQLLKALYFNVDAEYRDRFSILPFASPQQEMEVFQFIAAYRQRCGGLNHLLPTTLTPFRPLQLDDVFSSPNQSLPIDSSFHTSTKTSTPLSFTTAPTGFEHTRQETTTTTDILPHSPAAPHPEPPLDIIASNPNASFSFSLTNSTQVSSLPVFHKQPKHEHRDHSPFRDPHPSFDHDADPPPTSHFSRVPSSPVEVTTPTHHRRQHSHSHLSPSSHFPLPDARSHNLRGDLHPPFPAHLLPPHSSSLNLSQHNTTLSNQKAQQPLSPFHHTAAHPVSPSPHPDCLANPPSEPVSSEGDICTTSFSSTSFNP